MPQVYITSLKCIVHVNIMKTFSTLLGLDFVACVVTDLSQTASIQVFFVFETLSKHPQGSTEF